MVVLCNGYHTKGSGEASRIARAQADSETTVQSNLKVKKRAPHVVARACHFRLQWARRAPYGFNVTSEDGKPLVSFAYASRALAEAAATHPESALLNRFRFIPTQKKRAFRLAELSMMHRMTRSRLGQTKPDHRQIDGSSVRGVHA
jgi:hypothetical protein